MSKKEDDYTRLDVREADLVDNLDNIKLPPLTRDQIEICELRIMSKYPLYNKSYSEIFPYLFCCHAKKKKDSF
jgi:hypothetical protein